MHRLPGGDRRHADANHELRGKRLDLAFEAQGARKPLYMPPEDTVAELAR